MGWRKYLLFWLWWWFYKPKHIPKLIKLYNLNIFCTSIIFQKVIKIDNSLIPTGMTLEYFQISGLWRGKLFLLLYHIHTFHLQLKYIIPITLNCICEFSYTFFIFSSYTSLLADNLIIYYLFTQWLFIKHLFIAESVLSTRIQQKIKFHSGKKRRKINKCIPN